MDVTPTDSAPKRPRSKSAASASKKTSVPATKAKRSTLTTTRKKVSASPAEPEVIALVSADIDVQGMIATAAFYLAAERGFSPGQELDDWLEAERRIKAQLSA